MSKAEEFLKANKRPKSGPTDSIMDEVSYMSEMADEDTENHVKNLHSREANIMVSVRCRPLTKAESKKGLFSIIKVMDSKFVTVQDPLSVK